MATELISRFPDQIAEITLRGGHGGAFEVSIDGQQVFSKLQSNRYPELNELIEPIRRRLEAAASA
jgi:selT/selW/selH-like putative selenoprotein